MFEQLGLIGCGLMGGSFALAMKRAGLVKRVVGYSKSPSTTEQAKKLGVIDVAAESALLAVSGSDIVLVAVPVAATEATLKAIRDNRLRAMAIGIPVTSRLAVVYTLAAGIAGAAGALMAQTTGFASLDVFALDRSADVMLMLAIGGVGWLYGGIAGAVAFKLMYDVIANITPQYWTFWIGLFLVVLVMVGRDRLIRPWTWFSAARQEGAP